MNTASFFLHPGEVLENNIQKAYVLSENEAVLLKAREQFVDTSDPESPEGKKRISGEIWLVHGLLFFFSYLFI